MPQVLYNGNGSTGGSVPTDATAYNNGDQVVVLGNTGSLVNNSLPFGYWNTAADGSGNTYFAGGKFNIGASDTTLYAQWYTTAGLTGGGTTTHYQFQYDGTLATATLGSIEPARINALLANTGTGKPSVENDFLWMKDLFGNVDLTFSYPLSVSIANAGGGAFWSPLTILSGSGSSAYIRYLMVAEVTEMFMLKRGNGWGYSFTDGNEGSKGEALSRYLGYLFLTTNGLSTNLANGFFVSGGWLNSPRADFVNNNPDDNKPDATTGCTTLFLYYLIHQLGFTIKQVIEAGAETLGDVYRNLTTDTGDPFPLFQRLLGAGYPSLTTSSIPGPNFDDPFPLAMLSFWVDKSTFGRDEVQDIINTNGGKFENAFWLVLEGLNKNTYLNIAPTISVFTGTFTGIQDIQIKPNLTTPVYYENPDPKIPQRIRLAYDIIFDSNSLNDFPAAGATEIPKQLTTSVTIGGNVVTGSDASTVFELVAGANPYFTNINPASGNVFYLSQDLRVMTVTPGKNKSPFGTVAVGKPVLNPANNTGLDTGAAFNYAKNLITYLNANYSNPSGTDPFAALPDGAVAFSDASSVAEFTLDMSDPFNPKTYQNYCFAIARVRLKGVVGSSVPANNVKVFFRLWKAQTPDTNFGSNSYPSQVDAGTGTLLYPLAPPDNNTIPMYASGTYASNSDYTGTTINNQNLQITTSDYIWVYYACYLNLYDSSNVYNNGESVVSGWPVGTHHCIVAEIAYDGAAIDNTGIIKNPENCDKLAQRNLQLTYSDNPGAPASHRIPQVFDVVPSAFINIPLLSYPDELMIDWGAIPEGSIANIYWPQASSSEVLDLANALYGSHLLTATDAHTIQCKTTKGTTYIPVPAGSGQNFAGLFTVDLPTTVVAGQEYTIVVRKISSHSRRTKKDTGNAASMASAENNEGQQSAMVESSVIVTPVTNWRYVTGTFAVKIPVTTKDTMLVPEENTLAIMKARLQAMSPANRWYPVLQRYIQYIAGRVDGLGGDSVSIKPSFHGIVPARVADGGTQPPLPATKDKCCREVLWVLYGAMILLFILIIVLLWFIVAKMG